MNVYKKFNINVPLHMFNMSEKYATGRIKSRDLSRHH